MVEFSEHLWTGKECKSGKEIFETINEYGICGKEIKDIRVIGMAGNMNKESLKKEAVGKYIDAGFYFSPIYDGKKYYKDSALLDCSISVDEPLVITFSDDSTFEILPKRNFTYKMSINQLKHIKDGLSHVNVNYRKIFKEVIGATLQEVGLLSVTYEDLGDQKSCYDEKRKISILEIRTDKTNGLKLVSNNYWGYELSLTNLHHFTHSGRKTAEKTYKELISCVLPVLQIPIYYGKGEFTICPVDRNTEKGNHYKPHIKISEEIVASFLLKFLGNYYDPKINDGDWHDIYGGENAFEIYSDNDYTYDAVKQMLKDIRKTAKMLSEDYENPELKDLIKRFYPYDFGWEYCGKEPPENFIKDRIYVAVDFYERFCRRLEEIMEYSPEFDRITFSGP